MTSTFTTSSVLKAVSALAAAVLAGGASALAADVTITVNGVRGGQGPLYVALQTESQFMTNAGDHGEIVQSPADGAVTVTLKDVPAGAYAVSVWHDIDADQVFDTAPDGRPLDGWAMVGGAALRAAPTFDAVKTDVAAGGAKIAVDMIYAD